MKPDLGPGSPAAGFLIAFCFALLAQVGVLHATAPIWDDAVFLGQDERIRELSTVFTAFGESYFGPLRLNEMYRPVVNASFAIDWWLSRSAPGDVNLLWFHAVNLLLHAANAGLVYLFLANLTGRKLGAPLLGACLFAVHPLAVEPAAWLVGRCDLLAAFFGLLSGILLLRSPGNVRFLVLAVVCYGLALFAKASAAFFPVAVALGVVAYRGLPVPQLFSGRHLPRFAVFAIPAGIWLAARWGVLGAPFPRAGGLLWHGDVSLLAQVQGVGRGFLILTSQIVLPARLCGDYSADPAFAPHEGGAEAAGAIGFLALLACGLAGLLLLRRRPKIGYPLLLYVVFLIPVLQVIPIGAIVADRFLYLPMVFVFLLIGEGLERSFVRVPRPAVMATTFVIYLLLGVQSHTYAKIWADPITFNEDVLRSYPGARNATQRLAIALSNSEDEADRDRALKLLRPEGGRSRRWQGAPGEPGPLQPGRRPEEHGPPGRSRRASPGGAAAHAAPDTGAAPARAAPGLTRTVSPPRGSPPSPESEEGGRDAREGPEWSGRRTACRVCDDGTRAGGARATRGFRPDSRTADLRPRRQRLPRSSS
jgi:hypothetical protein